MALKSLASDNGQARPADSSVARWRSIHPFARLAVAGSSWIAEPGPTPLED